MSYPENYKYSKDHEWICINDDGTALVGITNHAQEQLGDVVFVELPEVGSTYEEGEVFGVVESVKAVVDCYMPVSGDITDINSRLESEVELINTSAHKDGWMVKIQLSNPDEAEVLMDKAAYEKYLAESAE